MSKEKRRTRREEPHGEGEESHEGVQRIEILGNLDRRAAEAFYLELRRLAQRYGAEIKEFRIEKVRNESGNDTAG